MIEGNKSVVLAIAMQNTLHSTNKLRTEAISSNTYCEIKTGADADKYLGKLLQTNLKAELTRID